MRGLQVDLMGFRRHLMVDPAAGASITVRERPQIGRQPRRVWTAGGGDRDAGPGRVTLEVTFGHVVRPRVSDRE